MVAVEKNESYPEAVIRAVDGSGFELTPGSKVFIKIDIDDEKEGTDLDVLRTLIKICFVRGATEVTVADRADDAAKMNVYKKAAEDSDAKFIRIDDDEFKKVRSKGAPHWRRGFRLPASLLAADAVILAPRVNIDENLGFRGALTAGYDLISKPDRFKIDHLNKKVERIVEIQSALKVVLSVVDATSVSTGGQRFKTNTVIAGKRIDADSAVFDLLKSYGARLPSSPGELPVIAYAKSIKIDSGSTEIGLVQE